MFKEKRLNPTSSNNPNLNANIPNINLNKFLNTQGQNPSTTNISVIKPSVAYNTQVNKPSSQNSQNGHVRPTSNIMKGMFSYPRSTSPISVVKKPGTSKERMNIHNQQGSKLSNGQREVSTDSIRRIDDPSVSSLASSSKIDLNKFKVGLNAEHQIHSNNFPNGITFKEQKGKRDPGDSRNASKDSLQMNSHTRENYDHHSSHQDKTQSHIFSEMANSSTYYDRRIEESTPNKYKSSNPAIYTCPSDFENRRMIIEMAKLMLKYNSNYNNDPRPFLNELSIDISILDFPNRTLQKFNSTKYDKFLSNQSKIQGLNFSSMSQSINDSVKPPVLLSSSLEVKPLNTDTNLSTGYKNLYLSQQLPTRSSNQTRNNLGGINQMPSVTKFNLDEDSSDKMKWLFYLISPKVVFMEIEGKKQPFVMKLVPTPLCYMGLENYMLEYEPGNGLMEKVSVDLLLINHTTQKAETIVKIAVDAEISVGKQGKNIEFSMSSAEEAVKFVSALNYVSQLVKCKAYASKANFK